MENGFPAFSMGLRHWYVLLNTKSIDTNNQKTQRRHGFCLAPSLYSSSSSRVYHHLLAPFPSFTSAPCLTPPLPPSLWKMLGKSIVFATKVVEKRVFSSVPKKDAGVAKVKAPSGIKSKGQPKVDGKKKVAEGINNKATVEALQKFIETAEQAKEIDLGFSEEELAEHFRIGQEYAKQSTIRSNKHGSDLSTKIWLQQEAMRALRADLRAHAEIIDDTPPPPDRPWPIWMTPPIKGFNPRDYMGNKGDNEDEEDDEISTKQKSSSSSAASAVDPKSSMKSETTSTESSEENSSTTERPNKPTKEQTKPVATDSSVKVATEPKKATEPPKKKETKG